MDEDQQIDSEAEQDAQSSGTPAANSSRGNTTGGPSQTQGSHLPQLPTKNIPGGQLAEKFSGAGNLASAAQDIQQGNLQKAALKIGTEAGKKALLSNPWVWVIIGVILLFLLLVLALLVILDGDEDESSPPYNEVSINKSGPSSVSNGESINYSLEVTYGGIANDVIVTDPIPENTEYVASSPLAKTFDSSGSLTTDLSQVRSVAWSLKEIQGKTSRTTFSTQTLSLTIKPLRNDFYVMNRAVAIAIGGSGDPNITPGPDSYIAPNDENCEGYYTNSIQNNPLQKNFGDPDCTMLANTRPEDKDRLHLLFQQLDPDNADMWFFGIVPCESSYRTNAFFAGSPASGGAWGLLQMGSAYSGTPRGPTPGLPASVGGKNSEFDRGDLNWQLQVSNAINHNRLTLERGGIPFEYWQCAREE